MNMHIHLFNISLFCEKTAFFIGEKNISEKRRPSTNGTNAKYHSNEEEGKEGGGGIRGGFLDTTFGITEMINTLSFENAQLFMRALLPPP